MKKKIFGFLCLFFLFLGGVTLAQISPQPVKVTWGEKAFDKNVTFKLALANSPTPADADAMRVLSAGITIDENGTIPITVGDINSPNLSQYANLVPNKTEGYYLAITPESVLIIGHDKAGTFYGVQTFLQIMEQPTIKSCTITDYPSVEQRGSIEGFYGNPWSYEDRVRQFEFYGKRKLNTYIYGPKDDPYHGFGPGWRIPYPTEQAVKIKNLIQKAHENKVRFVWAVHPGQDIKWDDKNGDGIIDDFVACVNKFKSMYELGIRDYAVFFDDIGGAGADPKNQAKMMNYLTNEFVKKHTDVSPLIICPTQYNKSWSNGDYLSILGTQMDASVRIMWTGNSVVDMIEKNDMEWINAQISRKAFIWFNYPVTDYCADHILMGPTYGNGKDIANLLSGFTANPMEYAEASKVSLYSLADYLWNMPAYDSNKSWEASIQYLWPAQSKAFHKFCENNIDLGPTGHGLRRNGESPSFAPLIKAYESASSQDKRTEILSQMNTQLDTIIWASTALLEDGTQPEMLNEIKPWVEVLRLIGKRGKALVEMATILAGDELDTVAFINNYKLVDSLYIKQKAIRSRNFPGSIKSPNPTPANEVIAPFLKKLQGELIGKYRQLSSYGKELFPEVLLSDGKYYIKYNGKYLTNRAGNSNPTFLDNIDNINPQRQEWFITMDYNSGRYKIVNAQDQRYVNELGNFGTNEYYSNWNSYNITMLNGKFAIRNAGDAGKNYWNVTNNRIEKDGDGNWNMDKFRFEIVPIGKDSITTAGFVLNQAYNISYKGKYLTASGSKMQELTFTNLIPNNSRKQQWKFSLDKATGRIKMINIGTGWYVNENGVFGTNNYEPTWNTYIITELGQNISIQNAGNSGEKYWGIKDNGALTGGSSLGLADSYIFKLTPIIATGIGAISTVGNTHDIDVYSINGTLVAQNVTRDQLAFILQKGIYIVNGKKIVIE